MGLKVAAGLALFFFCTIASAQIPEIDLEKIKQIESSGNPLAVSRTGARGLWQISDICRREFNERTGADVKPLDLFRPSVNRKIADWYLNKRIPQMLKFYGRDDSRRNRLISWNCGIGCLSRPALPAETISFLEKYEL